MTQPATYHALKSGTPTEPQANRRAPVLLKPAQVRLRTFGGNPARTCRSSLYVCVAVEECEGDDICREHGAFLLHANGHLPIRCAKCREMS